MLAKHRWLVPGVAVFLVVGLPGIAEAGINVPNGSLVSASSPKSYSYSTSADYWSVFAIQPTSTSDFDMTLLDSTNKLLGSSDYGTGVTDFVAVDSNAGTRPLGTYTANVTQYLAGGSFWAQAQYGTNIITLPPITHQGTTGFSDPDIAYANLNSNNIVSIADIYLTAGQSFWAVSPDDATSLYLLEANPSQSTTFVQGRSIAGANQHTQVIDNCTLYTAQLTGWHALVLIGDRAPVNTSPQQGIGIGLHRYDPTQPNYCPIADFPGPTP